MLTTLTDIASATVIAQAPGGPGPFDMMLPFLLMIPIIYFLIIRPQNKRVKEQDNMRAAIKKGDNVITAGGLVGKVTKAKEGEDEIEVEIAKDTRVIAIRQTIATVRVKGDAA